jgi:hypothetical protein
MHIYTTKEKDIFVPSVTTITSFVKFKPEYESLILWANALGFKHQKYKEALDATADFGTNVHEALSNIVQNKPIPSEIRSHITLNDLEKYDRTIRNFVKFYNESNETTMFSEKSLISKKLGYGGTIDWVSTKDNTVILTDFKTSNTVRVYMGMQVAAYIELLKEIDVHVDSARILLVSTPKFQIHEFSKEDISKAYDLFQKILYLYNAYHEDDKDDINENSLIIV